MVAAGPRTFAGVGGEGDGEGSEERAGGRADGEDDDVAGVVGGREAGRGERLGWGEGDGEAGGDGALSAAAVVGEAVAEGVGPGGECGEEEVVHAGAGDDLETLLGVAEEDGGLGKVAGAGNGDAEAASERARGLAGEYGGVEVGVGGELFAEGLLFEAEGAVAAGVAEFPRGEQ